MEWIIKNLNKMKKEFIKYEQALELKELGFDEPFNPFDTFYYRNGDLCEANKDAVEYFNSFNDEVVLAPLYQQAFRWFRKNHGLYSSILPKKSYPDNYVSGVEWYVTICGGDGVEIGPDGTYTYEEAELECLNKLIEIVKQPKKD